MSLKIIFSSFHRNITGRRSAQDIQDERRKEENISMWYVGTFTKLQAYRHRICAPLFNEGLVNAHNWDNHIIQDISWAWSGFLAFKQQGPTAMSY